MNIKNFFYFILSFLLFLNLSYAQSSKKRKPRKEVLSFDDELVQGSAQKPELFYLLQKKRFNYKRLIRLRKNFLPEMRKASENVHLRGKGD